MMSYKRWSMNVNRAIKVIVGESIPFRNIEQSLKEALRPYMRYKGPLVCPICGFKARTKYSLKAHIRKVHLDLIDSIIREV